MNPEPAQGLTVPPGLSPEEHLRALLAYRFWRVQFEKEQPEVVPLDDGTPMLLAESDGTGQVVGNVETLLALASERDAGLTLDPEQPSGRAFRPSKLPALRRWLRSLELETAIAAPGPGQARRLLEGPWWVAVAPETGRIATVRDRGLEVVTLLTAPDAVSTFRTTESHRGLEVAERGAELWSELAARTDYDGLRLNPLRHLSRLWPPHLPAWLAQGRDPRPEASPLPVRNLEEVELWLDQEGARPDQRTRAVEGQAVHCRAWWGYQPREVAFRLDASSGGTQILCAGFLVARVRGKLAGLPADPKRFSADQRRRAADAARCLEELEHLVEGQAVPFSALRTPAGARLWRLEPDLFTSEWLQATRNSLRS